MKELRRYLWSWPKTEAIHWTVIKVQTPLLTPSCDERDKFLWVAENSDNHPRCGIKRFSGADITSKWVVNQWVYSFNMCCSKQSGNFSVRKLKKNVLYINVTPCSESMLLFTVAACNDSSPDTLQTSNQWEPSSSDACCTEWLGLNLEDGCNWIVCGSLFNLICFHIGALHSASKFHSCLCDIRCENWFTLGLAWSKVGRAILVLCTEVKTSLIWAQWQHVGVSSQRDSNRFQQITHLKKMAKLQSHGLPEVVCHFWDSWCDSPQQTVRLLPVGRFSPSFVADTAYHASKSTAVKTGNALDIFSVASQLAPNLYAVYACAPSWPALCPTLRGEHSSYRDLKTASSREDFMSFTKIIISELSF